MAAVGSKGGAAGCSNGAGCTSGVAAGGSNWAAAGPNGRPDPYKTGGTNGIGGGTDQLLGQGHGNRGTSSMVFGLALGRASGPSSGMMVSLDTALAGSMGLLGGLSGAMVLLSSSSMAALENPHHGRWLTPMWYTGFLAESDSWDCIYNPKC